MCGRYAIFTLAEIGRQFEVEVPILRESYNVAPTQMIPAVRLAADSGARELVLLRWGLIPRWADDPSIGNRMINARSETIAVKPAFREAFRRRRCIVPANGFYEWAKLAKGKQPYHICLRDEKLMGLAGLWESWRPRGEGETIESCTIITTDANELVRPMHDRMPAIIPPEHYATWLSPQTPPDAASELLAPYPAGRMTAVAVHPRMGRPENNDPACIEPLPFLI